MDFIVPVLRNNKEFFRWRFLLFSDDVGRNLFHSL